MSNIIIDLTPMRRYMNFISKEHDYELVILENYSYLVTTEQNTYKKFISNILNTSYREVNDYAYGDINIFYKESKIYDYYERFIFVLEYLLFAKITPYIDNIVFNRIVSDDDKFLVEFFYE